MFGYTKIPKDIDGLRALLDILPFETHAIIGVKNDIIVRGNATHILAAAGSVLVTLYDKGNGDEVAQQLIHKIVNDLGIKNASDTYSGPICSTVNVKKKKK